LKKNGQSYQNLPLSLCAKPMVRKRKLPPRKASTFHQGYKGVEAPHWWKGVGIVVEGVFGRVERLGGRLA